MSEKKSDLSKKLDLYFKLQNQDESLLEMLGFVSSEVSHEKILEKRQEILRNLERILKKRNIETSENKGINHE